jgi:excisionase family DNA binding protein
MNPRPSRIVHGTGELVLTPRGAALVLAALELSLRNAPPGYRFAAEHGDSDFAWLRAQCRLVASGQAAANGAAGGTGARPFRVVVPSSAPVPELLTTKQAARIMHVSPRAVVKRIEAGQLPARRVGREWAITEYDARCAANGRTDGRHTDAHDQPPGAAARERGRQ